METLYRRVMRGKRVTYVPVQPEPETVTTLEFTDGQCLTAAGALGTMLLMVFERNIPPHKRIARKINAVQAAVLDLYKGTGEPIHDDIADLMATTWDRVMRELSTCDRHGEQAKITQTEAMTLAAAVLELHQEHTMCGKYSHDNLCAVHNYSGRVNRCNCTPVLIECSLCKLAKRFI